MKSLVKKAVVAVFVAGLLAVGFKLMRTYDGLTGTLRPAKLHISPADVESARRVLGDFEEVSFKTSDGLLLRGWYAPSKNGAAVVFVHGGFGNRVQLLPEAGELVRRGIGALLYDSRASGDSEGTLQTWGDQEQRDVAAAFDFLAKRPDVDPARLGLQGFSIGGSTAALAAASDPRVHAVLLNATWTTLEAELRDKAGRLRLIATPLVVYGFQRAGVDVDRVRPIDRVAAIAPRPLLMIGGTADTDTPPAVFCEVYERAGAPKALHMVEGAVHGGYVAAGGADYLQRVGEFFAQTLAGAGPPPPAQAWNAQPPAGSPATCGGK